MRSALCRSSASLPAELHCLMAQVDAALEQQVLNAPQGQRDADIPHHHAADDFGRGMAVLLTRPSDQVAQGGRQTGGVFAVCLPAGDKPNFAAGSRAPIIELKAP